MEGSAAITADGDTYFPFPISIPSDEEHQRAGFATSYSPDEIEIQEAILLSLDSSRPPIANSASASSSSPPYGVPTAPESYPDRKGKRKLPSEDGTSDSKKKRSKRKRFNCAICLEKVQDSEKFPVRHCSHAFCNSCIGRYVAAKIAENVSAIRCPDPGCEEGFVEMDLCRDIIPPELFDRWNVTLCEDVVGDHKFYCPFKDCSALLINDGDVKIRESECPHCHRLFCARCLVPWHDGIRCKDFRNLGDDEKGEDDLILKKLAHKNHWQRCPRCKMYVSRKYGCDRIKCRCKQSFCYNCAAPLKKSDANCKNCNADV